MNVTLFGNRVFAEDRVKMRLLAWVLIKYNYVLKKGAKLGEGQTSTQEEHHGKTKAEIRVMHLQGKER